jgi:hypothetical protein
MAVGADHLALLDLVEDRLPIAIRQRGADVERLVAEVIELEHDRIRLPAVGARAGCEVVDQVGRPLEGDRPLPNAGLIDVTLPIGDVVPLVVPRGI